MARYHFWSFIVNEEGQPIEGADISIYLAGTEESAYIFIDEFSGSPIYTAPQIKSLGNGYFEFWVPDINETYGYNPNQKFKITWNRENVEYGMIDYIDIFPTTLPVNEFDEDETRNKSVSNKLAYDWELHRLDSSHTVHGIEEGVLNHPESTEINKLVSDNWIDAWTRHKSYKAYNNDEPHGIKTFDLSNVPLSGSNTPDRVISFTQGQKWETHVEKDFSEEPHGIEQIVLGDSDTEINKLVSNEIIRELYYERSKVYSESVTVADWSAITGGYQTMISHNLQVEYPSITVWNLLDNTVINPTEITSMDENNIKITNNENIPIKVIING